MHLVGFYYENKIRVLIITLFLLHVSALTAPFSGRTILQAQNRRYFCDYIGLQTCIIHVFYCTCAFMKTHGMESYKNTYFIHVHVCSLFHHTPTKQIRIRLPVGYVIRWKKRGRGQDKIKVDVRKKYCEDERRTVSGCV